MFVSPYANSLVGAKAPTRNDNIGSNNVVWITADAYSKPILDTMTYLQDIKWFITRYI